MGLKRRQTYAEFEHPLEGEDFDDDADEEEYAGEMAYLLAQVRINFICKRYFDGFRLVLIRH